MELSKTFDPKGMDQRWYDRWMEKKLFASKPDDREPYAVVIPPPNVTGVLHMGHCLNNTIQDILIRRARMQGKNACWVPGTDHASIATEAKVVQMLREKGVNKGNLSREDFLKYAWEWKEKYGGIILEQLKKLGCSCDWDRTTFTMDEDYYRSVIHVFIDLYKKGHIYRGVRMGHWDPKAKTALSDEEVIYKEVNSKLYFIRYELESKEALRGGHSPLRGAGGLVIATVRPETILGDTAICVNPKDDRYKNLVGKFAFVPLINRRIPIIADEYVSMEFGTGALKVTPAHDMNDYQLGLKHKLEVVDVLNEDGTMSEAAQLYVGKDRFECRKLIVKDLEAKGHIVKIEDYTNQVGFSERTDVIIEPRLSLQWWLSMKELAKPALDAVVNEEIKFYPKKFVNLYKHWMENIKDWCISRQLWWGQRIPAWYLPNGEFAVAEKKEEAWDQLTIHHSQFTISDLKQDEDVLDTWFSSWLWPFEVFDGLDRPENPDVKYYYPTNTLVTAPEIIFFWVARMIMAGFEYCKEKPFNEVYFTGIVRDKQGRKMSKSLGNSPDLLELIDKYGADAVRFGILISSPAGNDLLYDEKLIEQGRNFNNKIWNALRLIKGWKVENKKEETNSFAIEWFENKLNTFTAVQYDFFSQFQLSEALKSLYSLTWEDFCSWYLEMIKPPANGSIDQMSYDKTISFFERLLILLHPFMPFITEEIFDLLREKERASFLITKDYPSRDSLKFKARIVAQGEDLKRIVTAIRNLRSRNGLSWNQKLSVKFEQQMFPFSESFVQILKKLANLEEIFHGEIIDAREFSWKVREEVVDKNKLMAQLEKDLEYHRGFLESVMKKLSNEKFAANAKPEVIELEKKKAADAKEKIRLLEERLQTIS